MTASSVGAFLSIAMPGRKNEEMSAAGEFIDDSLQREASWYRADEMRLRLGGGLRFYGASVGAIRGTVRDALRRHSGLTRDDVTALSSELWSVPVYERRLAAVVLLQSKVELLTNTDLTRIEGFVREAGVLALVDPLAVDVIGPLMARRPGQSPRRRCVGPMGRGAGRLAAPRGADGTLAGTPGRRRRLGQVRRSCAGGSGRADGARSGRISSR